MANHDLTEIGKYHIEDLVGEGAMGVVYRALDPVLNRHVAIKVMSDALARDEALRDRFLREARAAGSLQHPNVITIYDFGEVDGHLYIAMEFVDGSDLDVVLRNGTPLSLDEKLSIMTDVLNGLGYAHRRGVVHRDIKPANVRIDEEGHARIMDFGIAHLNSAMTKMTRTGMMLGTPNYMAPEQITGEEISPRTDIFAAGAVLYELLTNSRPFQADTLHAVLYKITSESPPSLSSILPGLPSSLNDVVMRALAKDPARRYPTALEMANDLTRVRQTLSHAPQASMSLHATIERARTSGKSLPAAPQAKKTDRRHVAYIGGGVAVAAVMLTAAALLTNRDRVTDRPTAPASQQGGTTAASRSTSTPVPATGVAANAAPSGAARDSGTSTTQVASGDAGTKRTTPAGPTPAELVQSAKTTAILARDRARIANVQPELLAPGDEHERLGNVALSRGQMSVALQHYQAAGNAWTLATERAQRSATVQREPTRPVGASTSATQSVATQSPPSPTPTVSAPPPVVQQPVTQSPPSTSAATSTSSPAPAVLPPPSNPQADISAVIAAYARAIDSRDINELRRAYPGMTRDQQERFQEFFSRTRSLHATFTVSNIDVEGSTAEARFAGVYEFVTRNGQSDRQNVSLVASLRRDAGTWKLTNVR